MDTPLKSTWDNKWLRALVLGLAVMVSGFALAACGVNHDEKEGIVEGEAVELGHLQYNVLFTRPLNIDDVEDSEYLVGQPDPEPDQTYIGVFVKIKNTSTDESARLPATFKLVDTTGEEFENIPSKSAYALQPGNVVGPEDDVPTIDSTPQVGPIQASMLLFKLPDEALELRPVELHIEGEDGPATVELDL
ncbi:MAG: hypothetical protein ACSLFI_03285 [Solirubrobacterales bacterium]